LKVSINHCTIKKARKFTGSLRALQRATQNEREVDARQERASRSRLLLSFVEEREVSSTRVLTASAPFGRAMANDVQQWVISRNAHEWE
jgi:hypothetical protein